MFFIVNPCTVKRGHKLQTIQTVTNVIVYCVHKIYFLYCVLNTWNRLPSHLDFSSFSRFKRSVKRLNFDGLRF